MLFNPPVDYIEPLFRPPSEGNSLILQVTNGCSWNKCTFCEMYTAPQKKFKPKAEDIVLAEIQRCSEQLQNINRVFLGDGDALVLSMRRLETILLAIKEHLPTVRRVSAYCLPSNLAKKSVDDLKRLRELGLKLIYIGAESGDNTVLQYIDKGETFDSTCEALIKAKQADIKTSVMFINGIGGRRFSEQHAIQSSKLANATQPDYLATLVLTFHAGKEKVINGFAGNFEELSTAELCREMELFIANTELEKSIFRSDHVSNHLVLKGVLGRDKQAMLQEIRDTAKHFEENKIQLRPSSQY